MSISLKLKIIFIRNEVYFLIYGHIGESNILKFIQQPSTDYYSTWHNYAVITQKTAITLNVSLHTSAFNRMVYRSGSEAVYVALILMAISILLSKWQIFTFPLSNIWHNTLICTTLPLIICIIDIYDYSLFDSIISWYLNFILINGLFYISFRFMG